MLDRFLPVWIIAAMVVGLLGGRLIPGLGGALDVISVQGVSFPIALGLLIMMYPVLAKVRYDRLDTVTGDKRLLVSSLVLNWIIGPALMFSPGLAAAARPARVPHRPDHRRTRPLHRHGHHLERPRLRRPRGRCRARCAQLGVPGDRVRRARLVLPRRAARLAGPAADRSERLAVADRRLRADLPRHPAGRRVPDPPLGEKAKGRDWYEQRFLPVIGPFALYGLLFTIVILFALQGDAITSHPLDVARIALPLLAYFAIMWAGSFAFGKAIGLSYERTTTLAFTAAGNNFELAIAVAIATFGVTSGQALAGVVGPLIEVPVLVALVYVSLAARRRWTARATT